MMFTLDGKPVFIVAKRIDHIHGLGYHVQHCKALGDPFSVGDRPSWFKQFLLVKGSDLRLVE